MNSSQLSSKIILCIFLVIFPLTTISAQSPKAKLFGLLGLSVDTSVDEKLFDILVEKLEELGIEEEEALSKIDQNLPESDIDENEAPF